MADSNELEFLVDDEAISAVITYPDGTMTVSCLTREEWERIKKAVGE